MTDVSQMLRTGWKRGDKRQKVSAACLTCIAINVSRQLSLVAGSVVFAGTCKSDL